MMNRETLKAIVLAQVDKDRDAILAVGQEIYRHPETGYREVNTTRVLAKALGDLGLPVDTEIAVTGCRGYANQHKTGPKVAVMGELDSVICHQHPDCDPNTGAMHACGHNIQTSVMYGVAAALVHSGALEYLDGKIDFMAVPAEEYIELDYRQSLKDQGKLHYFAGKPELIYRGAFDDVDLCMMAHNYPLQADGYKLALQNTGNGFLGKKTYFIGKQSHAGAAPWEGVNALNMANLAMTAMQAQRETFRDLDRVRIHQILNKAGDLVNSVPEDVQLETTVRARTLPALKDANHKVNRSIHAAAIAFGGQVKIVDSPGHMPLKADDNLARILGENAKTFYHDEEILPCVDSTASFDVGDLSLLMPVLHCLTSGMEGGLHAKDYRITDVEDAFIIPTKLLCMTIIDLLFDDGAQAREVLSAFQPVMTKGAYLEALVDLEQESIYGTAP